MGARRRGAAGRSEGEVCRGRSGASDALVHDAAHLFKMGCESLRCERLIVFTMRRRLQREQESGDPLVGGATCRSHGSAQSHAQWAGREVGQGLRKESAMAATRAGRDLVISRAEARG